MIVSLFLFFLFNLRLHVGLLRVLSTHDAAFM